MSTRIRPARPRRGARPFALRWSVSAIAICAACSAGAPEEEGSEHPHPEEQLGEVVYQGKVTDEALMRLLDHVAQPQSQPQVSVCAPRAEAALTRQTPIEFSFATSGCTLAPDARWKNRTKAAPTPARHASNASTKASREPMLSVLLSALPLGVAHAHGDPFNGTAYYLRVLDSAGVVKMQAFTDATTYTPNQAQWTRVVESGLPLRLEIVWAEFDNNEVVGNGPFEVPPVSFLLQE